MDNAVSTGIQRGEPILATWPAIVLGFIVLILGLYIPPQFSQALARAARILGVN
jgi:multidrug efflux pump subunit AcrB